MNFRTRPILLIILAVAAGIAVCHGADWPAFRGNQWRTGFYPDPVGLPSGAPAWKISLGCEIISSPSIVENVLYIGGRDSCVHAIDCSNGTILWKVKTGGWVDASPLIDGNRVIVGSRDSTIYLLDRKSGDIIGRMTAGVQLSSPALMEDGSILSGIGVPDGGISAFGASASLAKERSGPQWSISLPQYTYSSPAVHGQAVVIGATDGKLYGIDEGRKKTIWSFPTNGIVYLSTPAIDDTTVYFAPGDEDRNVYAVGLLTGRIIWKNETASPVKDTIQALAKNRSIRYVPTMDLIDLLRMSPEIRKRAIRQLRSSGFELPHVPIAGGLGKRATGPSSVFIPLGGMKTSSVAVGPHNVYVIQKEIGCILTNDSLVDYKQRFTLHSLDKKTGSEAWSFTDWRHSPLLGYCSSPVVTKDKVFFGWGEGKLTVLDAQSGKKFWEDSLQGNIISSPAIARGRLYVATMNGFVYAYSLSETPPGLDFQRSTYCYPNPARGATSTIQVYVEKAATLSLTLYNAAEKPVLRVDADLQAGKKYDYEWNLENVANGVYFALVKVDYPSGGSERKNLKIAVLR